MPRDDYDAPAPRRYNTGLLVRDSTLAVVAVVAFLFVIAFTTQSYGRWNRLQDERNQVQVNDIQIAQTRQLVQVEMQKAQIRVAEANGIASAQKIINGTLTPLYLQHEAIEAMQEHANLVFIPTGPMGVPMVMNPIDYMKPVATK